MAKSILVDAVILGGGIAGLLAAYELTKRRKNVIVVEKEKDLGGAVASYHFPNYAIEAYYHHFFTKDWEIQKLIHELGLKEKIAWNEVPTAFFKQRRFYRLFAPWDMLTFSALSWKARFQLGKLLLTIRCVTNPAQYDQMVAQQFIRRYGGEDVYQQLFAKLLDSKFGKDKENISAAWFIERILLRSTRGRNGEILGYLNGGFFQLVAGMEQEIKNWGGEILCNSKIRGMKIDSRKITHVKINNCWYETKYVLSTIPPRILLDFLAFPQQYKERIIKYDYQPAVCVLLAAKKKITPYYWANMLEPACFGAIVEHTNFVDEKEYAGHHLLYLASYVSADSPLLTMEKEKVFELYFSDVKKYFPHLEAKDIVWWRVGQLRNAGLIYKRGIRSLLLPPVTPYENLFVGGMFTSYPERSINESLKKGKMLADFVV